MLGRRQVMAARQSAGAAPARSVNKRHKREVTAPRDELAGAPPRRDLSSCQRLRGSNRWPPAWPGGR
eukprot:3777541-Alexandrium_andersonii.AAC.1